MQEKSEFISNIIKGILTVLIITLASVLVFAFIIKLTELNSVVIKSVNQFIKVISIFLGCSFFVKGSLGAIKGGIIGILSCVLTLALFSLFGAGALIDKNSYLELIFCLITGVISGIIAVNVKRRS